MHATGYIYIPSAGQWTFTVKSDDGMVLNMGTNMAIVSEFNGGRGPSYGNSTGGTPGDPGVTDSVAIAPSAGYYPYDLLYWQGGGGAMVQLAAASGSFPDPGSLPAGSELVGDTANGGLAVYAYIASYGGDSQNSGFTTGCTDAGASVAVYAPPAISITAPTGDPTYAVGQTVGSGYSCQDSSGAPGLTSCTGPAASGAALDTSTAGQHSFTVTAVSGDGWSKSATATYTVGAAPSATISAPANGAMYKRGQAVAAAFACAEGQSGPGLASCTGSGTNGSAINTSTPGRHTFTVTATSSDGQTTTTTATYTVARPTNRFTARASAHRNGLFTVRVTVPGAGRADVLITAWSDNLAVVATAPPSSTLLQPAPGRFVFARATAVATAAETLRVTLRPSARGLRLVAHHRYPVTLRLWVTYTPTGGVPRTVGFYGLHLR
ncbi:MAG TPA: GLEYA domain-containing protein [Solirubrobacteraceae bacterium]|nr:GLEYA domain-containing protein [Solirubrobacteraceae bacterium]